MKKIFAVAATVLMTTSIFLSAKTLNTTIEAQERSLVTVDMGWKKNGETYNYIDASGNKVKGWNRLNGMWYYFNSKGDMVKGKQTISNKTYLFNEDGTLNKEIQEEVSQENVKTSSDKKDPNIYYDKSGNPLGIGKKYISNASAYTGDTITASGQRPRWGTIAVDPRVIPLGSRVYIPYFDKVFIANDTGGIIRGTMIDIFMNSARNMNNFGRRNLEIIVLD
ncbi:3D (Asp-Asp-Asp) domain-containing protein [Peptostreptococcus russellii]|uniref:3D (Asp-Asp-Asp) domain-containing protein n=1 Tax=Peptostreptococcus russellii TaxID=215200 RepID=A0A1H8IAE8_9FIRM|nr:3D domain-containing protein [Peptostreptococcus russellii]SEN64798.1 3D (Asp-Asp-Asp) domain-containing protein [Peptostreptococcus russellii]